MPICKHCGARIAKFDNDMCPVCGSKLPLDGVTSDTDEITSQIEIHNEISYKQKKLSIYNSLCFLFPIFGLNYLYIKRYKSFLFNLLFFLLLEPISFSILYLILELDLYLSLFLPLGIIYLFLGLLSLILIKTKFNHKDGEGSYLR